MEVINIAQAHQFGPHDLPAVVERHRFSVAVGNFDGLHQGHQQVIGKALQLAERDQLSSGVLTFHPHPLVVLGRVEPSYLTPLPDKLSLLEQMGLDAVFVVEFTAPFSKLTPEQFVERFIIGLNIKHIVTGFDFRFGQKGTGNSETLETWSQTTSAFKAHILPSIDYQQEKISSSRVRRLLAEGRVGDVFPLLGRYHSCSGEVVHGEKRGRTIGFPTANIKLHQPYVLPKEGVYAVKVQRKADQFNGVLNLGRKPTFDGVYAQPEMEVHLFDLDDDLYGETLRVQFVAYIRAERKFPSVKELKAQIEQDVHETKRRLKLDKEFNI